MCARFWLAACKCILILHYSDTCCTSTNYLLLGYKSLVLFVMECKHASVTYVYEFIFLLLKYFKINRAYTCHYQSVVLTCCLHQGIHQSIFLIFDNDLYDFLLLSVSLIGRHEGRVFDERDVSFLIGECKYYSFIHSFIHLYFIQLKHT